MFAQAIIADEAAAIAEAAQRFMASGKPVIAPDHTAMQDYIDDSVAFVVKSSEEPAIWPQDSRLIYRTLRHRPDWGSLKTAYEDSYAMAKNHPQALLISP